jgi:hypothetical protein
MMLRSIPQWKLSANQKMLMAMRVPSERRGKARAVPVRIDGTPAASIAMLRSHFPGTAPRAEMMASSRALVLASIAPARSKQ